VPAECRGVLLHAAKRVAVASRRVSTRAARIGVSSRVGPARATGASAP
jgi:hypothetical protein